MNLRVDLSKALFFWSNPDVYKGVSRRTNPSKDSVVVHKDCMPHSTPVKEKLYTSNLKRSTGPLSKKTMVSTYTP